eukprot:7328062-Pyramimonas_sp.AAC.1
MHNSPPARPRSCALSGDPRAGGSPEIWLMTVNGSLEFPGQHGEFSGSVNAEFRNARVRPLPHP